ncbi:ribosomal RNA small subunit methyltransferase B [Sideroxyarcus emersonii]|uniref:16S rRNA (cytosine(967)-C(5))-methyltransferase n=1 Tax=Sideroxyarcus emersonii TaxID=2764705 RepID=A0AAN2BXN8_9PROT|nr:16S rRNA (cytosine(967)-C(5))-methyltransferase RsmB [Sideroxyarcus emersonii]BCK86256.1 ribosomal RNA small subunit methyltransferase B [Sideroxyarcus emersonii]
MQRIQLEAAKAVGKVVRDGRNLTQVLGETLRKQSSLNAQEKGALQDLCYGTLRYYARLNFILDNLLQRRVQETPLRCLLLVALYQLQHTRAGQYAIVDQAVNAAKLFNPAASGLVNAVLRNFLRRQPALLEAADQNEESRYAYPQWWIDTLKRQYGEQAAAILAAGNEHPPMTLRVNVRHTNATEYQSLLASQGIAAQIVGPVALKLERPIPVERLPNFEEGWVSVQDGGAQQAAYLLDVRDGMHVLDACAAPGGKTAHLLESADIDLVALDKEEERLQRVHQNLQRLHLDARVVCGDAATPEAWWDGRPFQRILADVPCSASGVVRRHPDIKWLRRPEDIESFAAQQAQILESLWLLLAGDGKLLYATCSVFARENQQVIDAFLSRHGEATRIALSATGMTDGQLLPNEEHDGFFYALLHKQA